MGDKYYVYALLDSSKKGEYIFGEYEFSYQPFYIGKGCGDRIKNTLYDRSRFKSNKINKLRDSGVEIKVLKIYDGLSNKDSISLEKKLIKLIGRRDLGLGALVNTTDGGDGRLNSRHLPETIEKISKNRTGKGVGWKHSEDTLNNMSINQTGVLNGFYGHTHSQLSKDNISIKNSGSNHPMFGATHSNSTKKIMKEKRKKLTNSKLKESCQVFNKEVEMYTLDMTYIKTFKSVKDTSVETGISESVISKCCRGDIINPTRYFFKYRNREDMVKNNRFLIQEGDIIPLGNRLDYEIVKRNKVSAIALDKNTDEECTLRYKDFPILEVKDTNDSDFVEMYLFLSKYSEFKMDKDTYRIYNDDLVIYYNKLLHSSELFLDKWDIFKRYSDQIKTINIFEDQWVEKKDIVKSRLLNLLGRSKRIYARKCVVKIVEYKDKKKFIDDHHIQGDVRSRINLGLYHNDELVSIMTFGGLRRNLGQTSKEGSFELLRFCNKIGTSVVGGASKLFKYFLKNNQVNDVISYADRSWSSGELYRRMGFEKCDTKIIPNYFYIIEGERRNRFAYRKDILVSAGFDPKMTEVAIQHSRGYYRIFDLGSFKYEWVSEL